MKNRPGNYFREYNIQSSNEALGSLAVRCNQLHKPPVQGTRVFVFHSDAIARHYASTQDNAKRHDILPACQPIQKNLLQTLRFKRISRNLIILKFTDVVWRCVVVCCVMLSCVKLRVVVVVVVVLHVVLCAVLFFCVV